MNDWKKQLQTALTSTTQLCDYLGLPTPRFQEAAGFAVRVPLSFANRMEKGNSKDPLLLQVMAREQELEVVDGFTEDPLKEQAANPIPGLLHKYNGRVLIVLTGSCAINCRYCFRRHFSYSDNGALKNWSQILAYIKNDASIFEVILSGGDPLLVDDNRLAEIISDLEAINHVTTLRFHTRLPVVIPARITDQFVAMLDAARLQIVTVLHINHANEIDIELATQLKKLGAVSQLLNQAVLLKGVNDSVTALKNLSHTLFVAGVLPYYLHQLDQIKAAHHFYVPQKIGLELIAQLRACMPGYLVPRYAQEIPKMTSKTVLA
jgi:EF-P beta-lysylation protein EpmB